MLIWWRKDQIYYFTNDNFLRELYWERESGRHHNGPLNAFQIQVHKKSRIAAVYAGNNALPSAILQPNIHIFYQAGCGSVQEVIYREGLGWKWGNTFFMVGQQFVTQI